jgi:ferric-dicitrate binding protein FerR (iron transport regulator)
MIMRSPDRIYLFFFILLVVLLLPALAAPVVAQDSVGQITELTGSARLERGGHEFGAVVAMAVYLNDKLRTVENSHLTVTLRDASTLSLGESSVVVIDRYHSPAGAGNSRLIRLLRGTLRTIVVGSQSGGYDFEVHTPNAVASVRGTEFETAYVEGRPCPEDRSCMRYTTVGVYDGRVLVSNPGNSAPPVAVTKGYETTIPCEAPPTSPAPLGMEQLGAPGYN